MSLKFTLLGCGRSFGVPRADGDWGKCNPNQSKNYRTRCSALISTNNLNVLIDTSPDLRFQLIKQNIKNINNVIYTHFHGDHFAGLPFLFLEMEVLTQRRDDLWIIGPPGVQSFIEDLTDRFYPGLSDKSNTYRRIYVEANVAEEINVEDGSIMCAEMNHGGDDLHSFGYRLTVNGQSLAYTGATMYCDGILDIAQTSRVLVVDCTYGNDNGHGHLGIDDISMIRQKIEPETSIILTHIGSTPNLDGLDNVILAEDFARYEFS